MEVSVQAGRIVGEHWRLRSRLGDEGTSRYWEAEELRTGSHVAIEFACVDVADPQARLRFSRETRALIAFRSPHVVRTLHRGLAGDGLAFAVTELLHGEDLGNLLAREPALGLADATQILDQVCRGICRLDAARIPYQVVEPKHVLVVDARHDHDQSNARVIKLLNVALDDQTPRKRTRSSSQYVSPEGLGPATTVRAVNEAAQVWALGVLGCRMLTGALPFDADSRGTLADDWGARFTRLRETKTDLPVELDEWFRTAIHPDPGQRFATVEQAGLALGHIATTYASSVAARLRSRLEMDRFSPKSALVPSRTAPVRSEPQRASVPLEREQHVVAAPRARAAVLELDRTAGLASLPPPPEVRASQVSLESRGSAAVDRAVDPVDQGDDVHDRETVASRVHAAAAKRRKKVVASERVTSLGPATSRERPDSSQVFARTPADVNLTLGFVREPAAIVVREQATLTPDGDSLGIRPSALLAAPAQVKSHVVSRVESRVVNRPSADRDLAFIVGRSDSLAAERARVLRIERARWRASAVLAVVLGLFGGFALRSIVSMKLRSAEHAAADGAAFEEGVPARSVIQAPPAPQPLAAGFEAARPVAEPAAPVARLASGRSGSGVSSVRVATNVRPGPGENAASASPFKRTPPPAASRNPPALDMSTETPPSAVASSAALPAAPPPVDTTPLQVYRGF